MHAALTLGAVQKIVVQNSGKSPAFFSFPEKVMHRYFYNSALIITGEFKVFMLGVMQIGKSAYFYLLIAFAASSRGSHYI